MCRDHLAPACKHLKSRPVFLVRTSRRASVYKCFPAPAVAGRGWVGDGRQTFWAVGWGSGGGRAGKSLVRKISQASESWFLGTRHAITRQQRKTITRWGPPQSNSRNEKRGGGVATTQKKIKNRREHSRTVGHLASVAHVRYAPYTSHSSATSASRAAQARLYASPVGTSTTTSLVCVACASTAASQGSFRSTR